jgi:hypothetical protein
MFQLTLGQLAVFSARARYHALPAAEQRIYTTPSNRRKQFGRNLGAQAILTVAILFHERAISRAVRPPIDLCQISRIGSLCRISGIGSTHAATAEAARSGAGAILVR